MIITCKDGLVVSTSENTIPSAGMIQYEIDHEPIDTILSWYYEDGVLTAKDPYYYEKVEALQKKAEYQAQGEVEKANQWGLYHAKLVNNIPAERPE